VFRGYRTPPARLFILSDSIAVGLAWVLAYHIRFTSGLIPVVYGTPEFSVYVSLLPLVVSVWGIVFVYMGVYRQRRRPDLGRELLQIAQASFFATGAVVCSVYLALKTEISRVFYLCFFLVSLSLLSAARGAARVVARRIRSRGRRLKRVLLVGTSAMAGMYLERVKARPELGMAIHGIVADPGEGDAPLGVSRLGSPGEIRAVIEREKIDVVAFAPAMESYGCLPSMLKAIEDLPVDIQVVPDVFRILPLCPGIEDFEGIPVVQLRQSPQQGWEGFLKRLLDVVIACMAAVVVAPVVALSAAMVLLCSGRPVFYTQRRMGFDGKEFRILKLRTMHVNAEEDNRPVWPRANDPRRTAVGALLRRYSLDELPQLLNVIKGDMSLVGPRPERPELIAAFREKIPGYMLRYKVKAGLTGWAQVHGLRGDTSLEKRIEYDIQYMQRWSLGLDMKILWMTLWRGFVNTAEEV
jgi:Undecaprenyl-phosphate glucose phosphotransferase